MNPGPGECLADTRLPRPPAGELVRACPAPRRRRCRHGPMPEHGFAPTYRTINYPDRQRKGINNLSSGSTISLTQRPLSTPSMEFVDTAPGTYNLPSMFSPPNVHGISGSELLGLRHGPHQDWRRAKASSAPLQRRFDGQRRSSQRAPASENEPLATRRGLSAPPRGCAAMSGRLTASRALASDARPRTLARFGTQRLARRHRNLPAHSVLGRARVQAAGSRSPPSDSRPRHRRLQMFRIVSRVGGEEGLLGGGGPGRRRLGDGGEEGGVRETA